MKKGDRVWVAKIICENSQDREELVYLVREWLGEEGEIIAVNPRWCHPYTVQFDDGEDSFSSEELEIIEEEE